MDLNVLNYWNCIRERETTRIDQLEETLLAISFNLIEQRAFYGLFSSSRACSVSSRWICINLELFLFSSCEWMPNFSLVSLFLGRLISWQDIILLLFFSETSVYSIFTHFEEFHALKCLTKRKISCSLENKSV